MRIFGRNDSIYDEPISAVLTSMNEVGPDSEEYSALVEHLDRLAKMKAEERRNRVSPDTMAIVAGNLVGVLIIVAYERSHVMTSKGLGFVINSKPH